MFMEFILAATRQLCVFIGKKKQLTGRENVNNMRIVRHALTHKLQMSGPTVYSHTVMNFRTCGFLKFVFVSASTFQDEYNYSDVSSHCLAEVNVNP